MPFLIDGHNLIPKLGLRLDTPDDEMDLVRFLQDFARIKRQQVEVYFDGAPAGFAGVRKFGTVKAHFISRGRTADSAIRTRLNGMGKSAKNWTIVSSDWEVQGAAKAHQAIPVSSEEFANLLRATLATAPKNNREEKPISSNEVEEWLRIFGGKE